MHEDCFGWLNRWQRGDSVPVLTGADRLLEPQIGLQTTGQAVDIQAMDTERINEVTRPGRRGSASVSLTIGAGLLGHFDGEVTRSCPALTDTSEQAPRV
jgi:hypothetical protein